MTDFSYSYAPGRVRNDIIKAHSHTWNRLAKPGTWWTGSERIEIAAETRRATSHAMMLRASVEMTGGELDINAVTGDATTVRNNIAFGDTLLAFTEAAVGEDEDALVKARSMVIKEMGAEAIIDAAALVGNFQRMVRIANATGIPLDKPMVMISEDLQKQLGLKRFNSAASTPSTGLLIETLGGILRSAMLSGLRVFGAIHRKLK